MKSRDTLCRTFAPLIAIFLGLAFALSAAAQSQPAKADVRKVVGNATYSIAGGPAQPINVGDLLPAGATVKTGPGSWVILYFGRNAGFVKVGENTTMAIDKFNVMDTGAEQATDLQLNLPEGVIGGNTHKITAASKFEVKLPTGIAGIRGTVWRCSANGVVILLSGSIIYVDVPPDGNPVAYPMSAPPPVYFQRGKGVQPLPDYLLREVKEFLRDLIIGPPPPELFLPPIQPYIYVTPVKPPDPSLEGFSAPPGPGPGPGPSPSPGPGPTPGPGPGPSI